MARKNKIRINLRTTHTQKTYIKERQSKWNNSKSPPCEISKIQKRYIQNRKPPSKLLHQNNHQPTIGKWIQIAISQPLRQTTSAWEIYTVGHSRTRHLEEIPKEQWWKRNGMMRQKTTTPTQEEIQEQYIYYQQGGRPRENTKTLFRDGAIPEKPPKRKNNRKLGKYS